MLLQGNFPSKRNFLLMLFQTCAELPFGLSKVLMITVIPPGRGGGIPYKKDGGAPRTF